MQKLLFTMFAVLVLSMLSSSVVTAEPTHPNEVGLYMTPHGYGATGTDVVWGPVDVYLVLTKPSDVENNDEPYATINVCELSLTFNPVPNNDLYYMGTDYPVFVIDLGQKDINQGFLEYYVGYASDVPVTDESVVFATIHFFTMTDTPTYVTLGPVQGINPSIPGQMCFQSVTGQLRVMHSVGGSHDAPVFIFNGEAVDVEEESFGSVKALYR
jgi:hypothetical protein